MTITFQINYRAAWGQTLCVIGTCSSVTEWTETTPLRLSCEGADFWSTTVPVSDFAEMLTYRYAVLNADGSILYEDGKPRNITLSSADKRLMLRDFWQNFDYEKSFLSTAFQKSLFLRNKAHIMQKEKHGNVRFSLVLPQIMPTQGVALLGNQPELGGWNIDEKVVMSDVEFPLWNVEVELKDTKAIVEYKYVVYDLQTGRIVDFEGGENRIIRQLPNDGKLICSDLHFQRTQPRWKGAGVAVPVFSLRTNESFGIGEFADLEKLADWVAKTGQKMIQTLPINDTTLYHTNRDSYPYNAVSVFALNPVYLNIEKMGKLRNAAQKKRFEATKVEFNNKPIADYQVVADEKMTYFRILYKQEKAAVFSSSEYKAFFEKNKEWLVPYAVFCCLRDKYGTPHFHSWAKYSIYKPEDVALLADPAAKTFDEVALHYFLQFHLDKQLTEAKNYAHNLGIALKGDIPIGISPDSVEAWTNPELFNLDAQAGAPPDDFSVSGQNWGFPTYNWDVMEQDGFGWWKKRFRKMADYFDAYRIDHILGFFRIWEMGKDDVWGLTGRFSPALPYSREDLWNMGISLDEDRLLKPYIRANFLGDIFGCDTEYVKENFLLTNDGYIYYFRPEFDTQKKIQAYFKEKGFTDERHVKIENGLYYLHCEVLFVRDLRRPELMHPRIALYQSHSYNELWDDMKQKLGALHEDYFYHRHNEFWKESAMRKLPALIAATDMLVCGEDLGMVPASVPEVMNRLNILSLEIQRMPKDPKIEFFHPADAPYLSVCTTGTHDMNPLRAWWEENHEITQRFYNNMMGYWGEAPLVCTPEIVAFIINQHMYSPAMWVILPLQDWMALDDHVRLPDAHAERINVPDNPLNFWCYRMHLKVEELIANDAFCHKVKELADRRN